MLIHRSLFPSSKNIKRVCTYFHSICFYDVRFIFRRVRSLCDLHIFFRFSSSWLHRLTVGIQYYEWWCLYLSSKVISFWQSYADVDSLILSSKISVNPSCTWRCVWWNLCLTNWSKDVIDTDTMHGCILVSQC